ncbi:MAG: carboxylating nicotinate-nucleotide diphosphorylase [Acidimicrobiia bacterium]
MITTRFDAPRHAIRDVVSRAIAEDLGPLGDLTASLIPPERTVVAEFRARADGVLAGAACADEAYRQLGGDVHLTWNAVDGAEVRKGTVIATIEGRLRDVLTGERTALNFLCHLSGIASLTNAFVRAASERGHAKVWDTRKTLPGLRALQKAAVRAGGGVNHRGSLSDFVLVKDNHLAGISIGEAVATAKATWPGRVVEVECDRLDQVHEALAAGAGLVLLDNMTPAEVAECVAVIDRRMVIEVSGGVTLSTVGDYAAAGADLISTSVITQSAPAFDIGLDLQD